MLEDNPQVYFYFWEKYQQGLQTKSQIARALGVTEEKVDEIFSNFSEDQRQNLLG